MVTVELDRDLAGFFAGIDHRFAGNWIAGLASGYTNASVSLSARSSSANINTGHVAAYGGGSLGAWNFIGAASASFNSLDTSRNIVFPGFSDVAGSSTQAITSQLFGETGYGVTVGRFAGEPFAGLAYVHLATDPFAESGSTGAAALAAPSASSNIGFSTLGLRLATDCGIGNGMIVTLHASAAWQHAIGAVTPTAPAEADTGQTGTGDPQTVTSPEPNATGGQGDAADGQAPATADGAGDAETHVDGDQKNSDGDAGTSGATNVEAIADALHTRDTAVAYLADHPQDREQLLAAFDGFIATKAGDFEMAILEDVDLHAFTDEGGRQSYRVGPCPLDEEMHVGGFEGLDRFKHCR